MVVWELFFFFFFQAEDGIRDKLVTGVQTCALPILAIFGKMGVVWPLIINQRLVHLTPHMFPCHRSHSWISGGDHFLVKNTSELACGVTENGRSLLFSTKMEVVWPLMIDQRLVHLTPHMFPCHRSHSCISGGDHFLGKNP